MPVTYHSSTHTHTYNIAHLASNFYLLWFWLSLFWHRLPLTKLLFCRSLEYILTCLDYCDGWMVLPDSSTATWEALWALWFYWIFSRTIGALSVAAAAVVGCLFNLKQWRVMYHHAEDNTVLKAGENKCCHFCIKKKKTSLLRILIIERFLLQNIYKTKVLRSLVVL